MKNYVALHKQDEEQHEMPVEEAIELARGHHMAGNFILAERTYNDILRTVPDNPTTNHLLGALYFQVGNYDKAIDFMGKSVEVDPDEKQYWSNYGSVYYMQGDYDQAIENYDKALRLEPEHVESLNRKAISLFHKEEYDEAIELCNLSLELAPDNLEALVNLGISLARLKKYKLSDEVWQKSSELYPQEGRIWNNWANMLRETHRLGKAKQAIEKALEIMPEDVEVLNNYGCILRELGKAEQAIDIFTQATNIRPKHYQAHYNKALSFQDLKRFEDAAIAARYAIDFKDDYVDGYNALSLSLVEIGEFSQAHYAAQRAIQLDPEDVDAYLNLADVLYLLNHFDDGHAALKEALKLDPNNANAYARLSGIYERLDEADDALWAIDKAIELAPDTPAHLSRKASILHIANEVEKSLEIVDQVLEMSSDLMSALITKAEVLIAINKTDEAKEILEKAKEVDKDFPLIYFTISNIKKIQNEDDEDFQKMLSLEDNVHSMGSALSAALYFAIAKGYENLKQYDKAFEYLQKANTEKRKTLPYDETAQPKFFAKIKSEFSPEIIKDYEGKGFDSDKPVFIVGMPRSGTTLTEQIISSHPEVFGAGELPDIMRTKRRIGDFKADNLKEAGEIYVELSSARDREGNAKRITDKMPGNYLHIGVIASILPNAKIIHCCRNPMDTCLSNYKQNFMIGQYWSYDLEEMGREYLRYMDLMNYWRELFPGRILDINYEDTVSDLEGQARMLIDHIGLEWNDACLEPHKQKRSVLTASKAQVTKPVYKSSVEKWKRYEEQFEPLATLFRENGVEV